MFLSVAIRILSSCDLCQDSSWNNYANSLLRTFVENAIVLYGKHFATYNVHGLNHLSADVLKHGPLDSFSAFPFENFLYQLKKTIRKSKDPLQQVVRREIERREIEKRFHSFRSIPSKSKNSICMKNEHSKGPIFPGSYGIQYKKCFFRNYFLSRICKDEANCCDLVINSNIK